jgi:hypothetical protein
MFRKLCLNMPDWAPAVPQSIPAEFRHQAQQLIMLGSMQQCMIQRMRQTIDLAENPCQGEQMLKAMEACMPRGALFSRTMLDRGRACGYARLCPWCHARSEERLYRQLLDGPCAPERLSGKHMIALRTLIEAGEELQPQGVRDARNDYRCRLRAVAGRTGMEGGVIFHQVTPWMPWYNRPVEKRKIFAHLFTLLGVVPSTVVDTLEAAIKGVCSEQWLDGICETAMLPAETPHALRYLLFGSSYKFDSSELDLVADDPRNLRYGIQGAAALQPWFLFDERQAWSYAEAMQGTRLYDTFGNWRQSQAGRQQCSRKRRAKSEYGNENRQWAFEAENHRRHSDADSRRRQLVPIALPYYQKFVDAGGKHLGSPALRKAPNDAGHAISDRDARWVAKQLPAMDQRTGFEKFVAKRTLARGNQEPREEVCLQVAE